MKVEVKQKHIYRPVTITLDTEDEFLSLLAVLSTVTKDNMREGCENLIVNLGGIGMTNVYNLYCALDDVYRANEEGV